VEYKFCVFIGRFQPLHQAHLQVVKQALAQAEQLILVIGSCRAARNIKNPWTFDERVSMVRACLTPDEQARIHFVPARDYYYSDNIWVAQIQQAVNQIAKGESSIALIGSYKDSSSYYIKYFPQWDFIPAQTDKTMNATDVRNDLFDLAHLDASTSWHEQVPEPIRKWINENFSNTPTFSALESEYRFIKEYKQKSKFVGQPWAPTFVTVDAVVIQSGHILVVRRKFNPGKGLIALPGGFVKDGERLEAAAIRELKEETGIRVDKPVLQSRVSGSHVFDHPGRSLRGRTITHGFCIKLPDGDLPEVRASDDADAAFWLPLMDVARLEQEFYEDHAHIIQHFVSRF
jgi:bifunctional NMN adenylyltransferase/nudix hydrolase